MSSVGHQRTRRPSLWDFHHYDQHNRFELDGTTNYCIVCFPDGEEVAVIVDPSLRLYELFEEPLRSRQLSVNDVAFYLENSNTPVPESSESRFFIGQRLLVRRRGAMRVGRHSRATHSMDDTANDRPSRKMSAEAVSRKSSFANSRMMSKSRQHSENKLYNGSDDTPERSIDSSLRDVSTLDDASTSGEIFDDGGTRRARSVASSRISLWGFGKDKNEVVARLEDMKADMGTLPSVLDIEQSWKDIVREPQTLLPRCIEQQEALWELVTTEKRYIEVLKNMSDLKMCLVSLQDAGFLKEIDAHKVFRNYDVLYKFHLHSWRVFIFEMVEEARKTEEPLNPVILQPWFTSCDWMNNYRDFTHKHNDSLLYLQKKRKDNQVFAEFAMWAESQQVMRRQKLTDTLTMPMQRLTRYSLLLKAVLSKSSGDNEETELLQMMITGVEHATRILNTEMNNNDLRMHMEDIQQQIDGYDYIDQEECERVLQRKFGLNLASPMRFGEPQESFPLQYRQLYHRGELRMRDGKPSPKMDVYCMVFTDMLLICRKKNDRLRVLRPPIHMAEIGFSNINDTSFIILQLNFILGTCMQMLTMHTSGAEETRRWCEVLEQVGRDFESLRQARMKMFRLPPFDSPMEEYASPYDTWERQNGRFRTYFQPVPGIVHRKSSSMDSQAVAAHAHMSHMHRVATVSSTEQLDRVIDRNDSPSRLPPRHKLSVASCTANPLNSSKSSVDLHLVVGGEPLLPVTRTRSRSNSSGPEMDGKRTRSPSPRSNGTAVQNGCDQTNGDEEPPTAHGRRFEKRYHTADGIEMKPRGVMPQGILKRFSWNVSSAVGGSSRKISAKLGEHSRRHSQASTVASTESFGSSTSGISSASDGNEISIPSAKFHVTSVAVNESPSESTLNISLDLLDADVAEEKSSPPAPPLPEIPPPLDLPEETEPPPAEPSANGQLIKYLLEQNLESSDV